MAAGEDPLDADEETRLALQGYRQAMTYVLQLAEDPDSEYSEQLLKGLHYMMTSYALKNRPGRWRAGAIYVRNDQTGEIVHEGPDIDEVPALMKELVGQLNRDSRDEDIVRAAMAHLNLAMAHPFRDGNGRMARCLQSLVLARGGVLSPVFMSVEEYLGRNTQAYYDVLARVGGGSWQPERDTRPWIRFMLTAHLRQARTMLQRIKDSGRMWANLPACSKPAARNEGGTTSPGPYWRTSDAAWCRRDRRVRTPIRSPDARCIRWPRSTPSVASGTPFGGSASKGSSLANGSATLTCTS